MRWCGHGRDGFGNALERGGEEWHVTLSGDDGGVSGPGRRHPVVTDRGTGSYTVTVRPGEGFGCCPRPRNMVGESPTYSIVGMRASIAMNDNEHASPPPPPPLVAQRGRYRPLRPRKCGFSLGIGVASDARSRDGAPSRKRSMFHG